MECGKRGKAVQLPLREPVAGAVPASKVGVGLVRTLAALGRGWSICFMAPDIPMLRCRLGLPLPGVPMAPFGLAVLVQFSRILE